MASHTTTAARRFSRPGLILSFALALLVVGCSAAGGDNGSSSTAGGTGGTGGKQSTSFMKPPATVSTPSVATAGATDQAVPPGVPGLTPTKPGQVPAFAADDMASFVLQHGFPNVGEGGTPTVMQKVFLPNTQVEFLTGYTTGLAPSVSLGYLELQGNFDFPTPPSAPAIHLNVAYMVFDAANGNIISWGGLKQPSTIPTTNPTPSPTTPTPGPTNPTPTTPPQATATPVPPAPTSGPPPKLAVRPSKTTAFCANGGWPNTITVVNLGGPTLNWSGSDTAGIALSPSSGSLGAGAAQTVTLSGNLAGVAGFTVHFTSNSGTADVAIVCQ